MSPHCPAAHQTSRSQASYAKADHGSACLQLQEYQERQKKIADVEAKLQDQNEQLAAQQDRIKSLHVRHTFRSVYQ